jgi:hypothetical protein
MRSSPPRELLLYLPIMYLQYLVHVEGGFESASLWIPEKKATQLRGTIREIRSSFLPVAKADRKSSCLTLCQSVTAVKTAAYHLVLLYVNWARWIEHTGNHHFPKAAQVP